MLSFSFGKAAGFPSRLLLFLLKLGDDFASLSFVARNLAILYRKTENFDPETSHTNGNAQGFESFALPRTRSFGFNLKVKF